MVSSDGINFKSCTQRGSLICSLIFLTDTKRDLITHPFRADLKNYFIAIPKKTCGNYFHGTFTVIIKQADNGSLK